MVLKVYCLAISEYALPQFTSLKIINMTTFPQDIRISFEKGVHVIFGGNHSGKTTIVNSIRYGIFGLSSSNLPEGLEKRYFVSRIKEIERKSLDVNTVFLINQRSVSTYRKVYSSGNAEINSIISDDTGTFSKSPLNIDREKEYYDALRSELGKINNEELDFISNLLFADENRNLILWTKNLADSVTRLLSPSERSGQLKALESSLLEAENRLNKLRQDRNLKENKQSQNERYMVFLETNLNESEKSKLEDSGKELENDKIDLENCRKAMANTSETFETELNNRRNLSLQLRNSETKAHELAEKLENLNKDFLNAFFRSTSSDVYHIGNYVYHRKQCPICSADLAQEISLRLDNKKCPLCGKSDLVNHGRSMEEIEKVMTTLEIEKKKIGLISSGIEQDITLSQQKIDDLNKLLSEQHALEASLLLKITNHKSIEEDLHKRDLSIKQSKQLSTVIKNDEKEIQKLSQEIEKVSSEIAGIKESQNNLRIEISSENIKILSKVRQRFSAFVDMATNGELKANLSLELIPELNGRPVFNSDAASQFERTLLDYAFRIALLSIFAEKTGTSPSLVLETPDEVADESYLPYLAKAIFSFSNSMSVIITTVNTEMMRKILGHYEKNERGRHFTDLVSKGTLTQRKFYEASITDFSESR